MKLKGKYWIEKHLIMFHENQTLFCLGYLNKNVNCKLSKRLRPKLCTLT